MASDKDIQKINYKAERLLRDLLQIDMYAKVGILADPDPKSGKIKANDPKKIKVKNEDEQTIDIKNSSTVNILDIALVHEFGTKPESKIKIPQRSFLRSTADEQKNNLSRIAFKLVKKELEKDDPDPFHVIGKIGAYLQGRVRAKFRNNDWPALKDPTRRGTNKEGEAKPLIDTGQLRRSITYEVVKK